MKYFLLLKEGEKKIKWKTKNANNSIGFRSECNRQFESRGAKKCLLNYPTVT